MRESVTYKITIIFFLVLAIQSVSKAQEMTWVGTVYTAGTNTIVPHANITCSQINFVTTANAEGEFEAKFKFSRSRLKFVITSIGRDTSVFYLSKTTFTNNKLNRNLFLFNKDYLIGGVDILITRPAPDTIYGLPVYNIGDFCFVDNKTLVLAYEKEKRWKRAENSDKTYYEGCQLILLDSNYQKLDTYPLLGLYFGIYTEYMNQVFLTSKKENYLVYLENNKIKLASVDHTTFKQNFEPVIDTINNRVIASTYRPDIPAFEYYSLSQKDSTYKPVHRVEDEEVMAVFKSEYKYLTGKSKLNAYRYEQKTGVDKEIVAAFMTGFAGSWFVKPIYAPAFTKDDTLIIFDHYSDMIYRYDANQHKIDSIPISYHKSKRPLKWKKKIIRDEITGEFYAKHEKNGYTILYKIDIKTGETEDYFKLYYKYSERLRIIGGEVYYIFRPFESSQKKFLYKEGIY